MNTKLFDLKPCPQCKGTGDAHHQGHDYDCGDCLGTGYEEPQKIILNLELTLKQHKESLKSSDSHNNELAQKLEIAWEQRDRLAEALKLIATWHSYDELHDEVIECEDFAFGYDVAIKISRKALQSLTPNAEL
jgi:hypothetical protein